MAKVAIPTRTVKCDYSGKIAHALKRVQRMRAAV